MTKKAYIVQMQNYYGDAKSEVVFAKNSKEALSKTSIPSGYNYNVSCRREEPFDGHEGADFSPESLVENFGFYVTCSYCQEKVTQACHNAVYTQTKAFCNDSCKSWYERENQK